MSERDIRKILDEVIADLDAGRVVPRPRGRLSRLGAALGAPAALAVGLAIGGCDEPAVAYGVPPVDASHLDAGLDARADARPDARLDDGATEDYGVPQVDGSLDGSLDDGAVVDYGVPQVDGSLDDGAVVDYGVPQVDGGKDAGN
ncbi:MAG: hypothetical protein RBU30_09095 [Polyangia bacterium]|jgi:hypothetical protein|nr:hypothetical protein [Polyangia bacterium]